MVRRASKSAAEPLEFRIPLCGPGMSPLHRAGLGGVASTLKGIERRFKAGQLRVKDLPGSPWTNEPPWVIEPQCITIRLADPTAAQEFFRRLFALSFRITDGGLIDLPGQYREQPNQAIMADLQQGLTLTFLQHGKVRKLEKEPTTAQHDPEGTGIGVTVEYRRCQDYKHQAGWNELVEKNGKLTAKPIRLDGPISPGTVIRHVAFGDSAAEEPPERMLPLYFALVGCLALHVNRGVAALIVPDVHNLVEFAFERPLMTPGGPRECQVANAADGALQMMIRLRTHDEVKRAGLPGCHAMTFMPTPWASQQKSRVATLYVSPLSERVLDRFAAALALLPLRIVEFTKKETQGRGKSKTVTERREAFRAESVVRPMVAENLACGRRWYAGFTRLMTGLDANNKPLRDKVAFERKGLHAMIKDERFWDSDGEALVVKAVHEAMRQRYGRIADDYKSNQAGMKNKFKGEYERLRLAFSGAKTPDQVRFALCDLFSRGGNNTVLRAKWESVLPLLRDNGWQLTRDLALLALASYAGRGAESTAADATAAPAE